MRKIKFRAWDKDIEQMLQPNEIARIHLNPTPFGLTLMGKTGDGISMKFILMQYTGLKDKNGKEIYEGDIFKITKEPEEINAVIFESGSWMFDEHGLHLIDWHDRGEVIGNIYENPKLLEENGGEG